MSQTSELQEITCDSCGEPCHVITIDNGIGHYEYWGAPGFHRDLHDVSDCCEDSFTDPNERDYERPAPRLADDDNPPF